MKKTIVVLYGPPGVGKLTIGHQLSANTGFTYFNGHKLADVVHGIFDFGTHEFVNTTNYLWLFLFKKIAARKIPGAIVSFVYGAQTLEGKQDVRFCKKIVSIAKHSGAKIRFIRLKCSRATLYRRVQRKSRSRFGKITSVRLLKKILKNYQIDESIPFVENLVVDTTSLTPRQTAKQITTLLKSDFRKPR